MFRIKARVTPKLKSLTVEPPVVELPVHAIPYGCGLARIVISFKGPSIKDVRKI